MLNGVAQAAQSLLRVYSPQRVVGEVFQSLDTTAFSLRDPIFTPLIVRIMQSKQLRLVAEYDD